MAAFGYYTTTPHKKTPMTLHEACSKFAVGFVSCYTEINQNAKGVSAMARHGFIRTKEEIKFLILYATGFLPFPVDLESIVDLCTWCDDGFGFFELKEAFDEMLDTAHMTQPVPGSYAITDKGRETMVLFERNLPFTVREAAQKSALRVVQQLRRDAAIVTHVEQKAENDLVVTMEMQDVFSLQMNVVSRGQASLLERSFRAHAEQIYQVLLRAVTEDYAQQDE